jgi:glycosyltransferase involved in cell wall biosynthesis
LEKVNGNPRVLHVLAPMRAGGLEQVVAMMSAGQRAQGVHVASVLIPGDADAHPFIARLEALGVPNTRVVVAAQNYVKEYYQLSALVARLGPRVVHTHGYRSDVIGAVVARAHQIPTVSTVHGFTGGGIRNRLYEWIQCQALKRADAVIAVSKALAEQLDVAGIPRERIHCLTNAFSAGSPALTRSAARERLGIPGDALVAGWVGRLSVEKGADVMLDALSHCDVPWRLSIIGDGSEREALHRQAAVLGLEDRITWHGVIDNAGSLFSAFDAFVLSSHTEGTPITLFEAMHAGVPVVATSVGGIPDVVSSSHAILVPPDQPAMLARALADVANDPPAAAHRAALASRRLVESFGIAGWLRALDAVYARACKTHALRD